MGTHWSIMKQSWPPKAKYSVDHVPDLSGKVMIVTGANIGVGKETVKALLQHNAKVYLAARSPEKAKEAIQDLKSQTGKEAEFLQLDLADLNSVKRAAQEFMQNASCILFNNAGVMGPPIEQLTSQGYDMTFGTNVLGPFYFTKLLLPTLIATAAAEGKPARVINTASSGAELFSQNFDYNTLKDSPARKKMGVNVLYFQSKFGNVAFSNELFRRYGDQGIMSCSLNPGNLRSGLQRNLSGLTKFLIELALYPTPYGALTQLYAGTSQEGAKFGGKYLIPWARLTDNNPSKNAEWEKTMWTWCEEQVAGL
ncbi:NAD(P)-binding protein [Favolaschia claudopus]|uniref:NAD(P)-binding protein n=1 Tax=Favolaschia claudopus TaxID=2862362 RepID=A0AAW0DWL9_9AGAR